MPLTLAILLLLFAVGPAMAGWRDDAAGLERSYWVHASLGPLTQKGYFGSEFPEAKAPSHKEVENAAMLLTNPYGANRLYLLYHKELAVADARRVFAWWRGVCPESVEIVPTLLLRMYDGKQTPVFTVEEARDLGDFFHSEINSGRVAVYDVYQKRDQGEALAVLARRFPDGMVRLGLQPGENVGPPFVAAVQDTWSGFCHGTRNLEDWLQPGFGAETLRQWVEARDAGTKPIAWNLIVVAWDYGATGRGGYPGYDDAEKNMPLPAGRNRAAAGLIYKAAGRGVMAGFSADLYILNENSRSATHDGKTNAFYQTLREGKEYGGYYAVPFREIVGMFHEMGKGQWPED